MNREYHQERSVLATHITPAILPKDYKDLESRLQKIDSIVDWVQIDVVDGEYAPNKTWPFVGDDKHMFSSIVKQDEAMPYWDSLNFEIDLMVKDPVFEVDRWIAAGAIRLVVHIDSISLDMFKDLAHTIMEKGVEIVLGFGINSSFEKLETYIDAVNPVQNEHSIPVVEGDENPTHIGKRRKVINWIQCMGIEKIGFQSQPFDIRVMEHIKKIKEMYPDILVSVDGGVSLETAPLLITAGADRLVVGSTLFNAESLKETIVELSNNFKYKLRLANCVDKM